MASPSDPENLDKKLSRLEEKLRDWWSKKHNPSDGAESEGSIGGSDLWADVPEIDSKAAAKTAPMCEEELDIDFEMSMIREGGYNSIDDMIEDLLPRLREKVHEKQGEQDDPE